MSFKNIFGTTCPTDCDTTPTWTAIGADQECAAYEQSLSQISDLILIPPLASDVFASWGATPTYVAASIDNTNTDMTKARRLVGMGGLPAANKEELEYPYRKKAINERTYTISFKVLNLTQANYDYLVQLQCNWVGFTFYYASLGTWVYGLEGGIVPSFIDVDFPKGEGNTDRDEAVITLEFIAGSDPERGVYPLSSL